MSVDLVIIELPSPLDTCPLYPIYEDFVSCSLETLQKDIETVFHVPRIETLNNRLMRIQMGAIAVNRRIIPEEQMEPLERLIAACYYDSDRDLCFDWLRRLFHRVITDSKRLEDTGVSLLTQPYYSGAYLGTFRSTLYGEYPTGGVDSRLSHHRSSWLRRGISERVREDISDQRLARWIGRPTAP